jgi:hypothetical protein
MIFIEVPTSSPTAWVRRNGEYRKGQCLRMWLRLSSSLLHLFLCLFFLLPDSPKMHLLPTEPLHP